MILRLRIEYAHLAHTFKNEDVLFNARQFLKYRLLINLYNPVI